jgi:hypothetical protein
MQKLPIQEANFIFKITYLRRVYFPFPGISIPYSSPTIQLDLTSSFWTTTRPHAQWRGEIFFLTTVRERKSTVLNHERRKRMRYKGKSFNAKMGKRIFCRKGNWPDAKRELVAPKRPRGRLSAREFDSKQPIRIRILKNPFESKRP